MNTPTRPTHASLRRGLACIAIPLAIFGSVAHGQTLYWDTGTSSGLTPGNGTWSTGTSDLFWATGTNPGTATPTFWTDGRIASFNPVGSSVVTISGSVSAQSLAFPSGGAAAFTITGGTLGITGAAGISSSHSNGGASVNIQSAIVLGSGSAQTYSFGAGSAGGSTIGGNIGENGTASINKVGTNIMYWSGSNTYTGVTGISAGTLQFTKRVSLYGADTSKWTATNLSTVSGANAAFRVGGTDEFTDSDIGTLAAIGTGSSGFRSGSRIFLDTTNAAGGTFTLNSTIANPNSGANVLNLGKFGTGTMELTAANTYTGQTIVQNGTLKFSTIGDWAASGAAATNLGAPTSAANGTINLSNNTANNSITLLYVGAGSTTNRSLYYQYTAGGVGSGVTIDSAGTGPIVFTSGVTGNNTQTKALTLTGSYTGAANEIRDTIASTAVSNLVKSGAGTWKLSGANTFTGATTINAGVLDVTTLANGGVASGIGQSGNQASALVFGAPSAALRYSGTANVTTDRGFTLSSGAGGGATIESSGAGTLSFDNTVAIAYGTTNQTRVLTLGGTNTGNNTFSKVIANNGTGATSLTKAGSGLWVLDGANTFSGTVTIGEGTLSVASIGNGGSNGPLGTSGTIALGAGTAIGTLRYTGAGETINRAFVLAGGTGSGGTIEANGSGPLTFTGAVTAASGNKTLTLAGSNTGNNSIGAIGNPATSGITSVVKTGASRWVLTGSSGYTGSTTIEQGELLLAASAMASGSGALGTNTNAAITIGSLGGSGTAALLLQQGVTVDSREFTIPGGSQATIIAAIDGSGTSTFGSTGNTNIILGRDVSLRAATGGTLLLNNTWAQASGTSVNVTVGGGGNEGTVQLGQPLAATGTVLIDRGVLRLSSVASSTGSLSAAANIVVGPAAAGPAFLDVRDLASFALGAAQTLSGTGTVQLDATTPVSIAGFFSPGNSPGIFTFDGAGTTTLSGTTFMEITGTTAGTSYDQVRFTSTGSLDYGSGRLLLDLTGTYADSTEFQLFDFAPTASGSFTTISGSGSYGLLSFVRGAGGVWTSGPTTQPSQSLEFREATGTLVVVPEPATLALAAIGIGLTGWAAIRRRK